VQAAVASARKLGNTDPAAALRRLKDLRDQVNDSDALSEDARNALLGRISTARGQVREMQRRIEQESKSRADADTRTQDRKDDRDTKKNKLTDKVKEFTNPIKDRLETNSDLEKKRNSGAVDSLNSANDYTIPTQDRTYSERTKIALKREDPRVPTLSKAERKVLEAMRSPVKADFERTTFKAVLEYLQEKTKTVVVIDKDSAEDVELRYDDPVSFSYGTLVSYQTVLKKVLGDKGLTFILKDGIIQAMTPAKAREIRVTRLYPVEIGQNPAALARLIYSIDPASWDINGGKGTIVFDPTTSSLIVNNSAFVHTKRMLGER
jgi:hypothetical protein